MRFVRSYDDDDNVDYDDDNNADDVLAAEDYDAGDDEELVMLLSRRNSFSAAFVAVVHYCVVGWRTRSNRDGDVPSRKRVRAVGVRVWWLAVIEFWRILVETRDECRWMNA